MTSTRRLAIGAVTTAIALAGIASYVTAQVLTPPAGELRFEAVLNEPISTPDGKSVVAGASALLIKDRRTGQCFVAVRVGGDMGLAGARCEP